MLLHKSLIILIALTATFYNFSGSVLDNIEYCDLFERCMYPNGTFAPVSNNSIYTNQTLYMLRRDECIRTVFCNCTTSKQVCTLTEAFLLDAFTFCCQVTFWGGLLFFLCVMCSNPRSLFLEEPKLKYLLRKLGVIILIYFLYIGFNILASWLIIRFVYNKTHFSMGNFWLNYPWIVFAVIFPIYLMFGTLHNEQIRRAISIRNIETSITYVDPPAEDCPICLDSLPNDNCIMVECCNKYFHLKCIKPVIITTNICPLCRHDPMQISLTIERVSSRQPLLQEV